MPASTTSALAGGTAIPETRAARALLLFGLAASGPAAAEPLICRGNEPFWSLTIEAGVGTYTAPGEDPATLTGDLRGLDFLGVQVWRGRGEGDPRDWVAVIETRSCADTMADQTFPMRGLVSRPDGSLLAGCCGAPQPATAPKDPATDWSAYLIDFLPAIESCLAATAGPVAVTKAWPMNHGLVGVRLRDREGRRFDCLAPHQGGEPVAFDLVSEPGDRLPGEFHPLFTPAPGAPPTGECYQNEHVPDPAGSEPLGWLSYDAC
jgi:uncharacterized membrane protein